AADQDAERDQRNLEQPDLPPGHSVGLEGAHADKTPLFLTSLLPPLARLLRRGLRGRVLTVRERLAGRAEGAGQLEEHGPLWFTDSLFVVADRAQRAAARFGELLLGEPGLLPQVAEFLGERHRRCSLSHILRIPQTVYHTS